MKFENEEKRIAAIEALDPSLSDYDQQFAEIEGAEIGSAEQLTEQVSPEGPAVEPPVVIEPVGESVFTIKKEELPEGYSDAKQVLKSHAEQRALIERQQGMIQKLMTEKTAPPVPKPVEQQASPEEAVVFEAQNKVDKLQEELDNLIDDDEDNIHSTEFRKKERELSKLQKEINTILYQQVQNVGNTAKEVSTYHKTIKEQEQASEQEKTANAIYNEVDSVDVPELKANKKSREVELDYFQYKKKIAEAYFGRIENISPADEALAMEQAVKGNPVLMANCKVIGIDPNPSEDVKKYMEWTKILDYRNGVRDPLTGQSCASLTMYDTKTQSHVPIPFKSAVESYRVRTGYYRNKEDSAYQRGAERAATAAMRRDKGAVEFDDSDQRSSEVTPEWAVNVVNNVNVEKMLQLAERGDKTKLEEYNRACKVLSWPELST